MNKEKRLIDNIGITTSVVCLIHCTILPLILIWIPFLSAYVSEDFHKYILLILIPSAFIAFIVNYYKHKNIAPMCCGIPGMLLVVIGAYISSVLPIYSNLEDVITVIGSILLILGHFINIRISHRYR